VLEAVAGPSGPPSRPPSFPGAPEGPRLPGKPPPVWNVPIQNAVFTGRDGMLARLRDGFTNGSRLQALHGIGGVGGVGKSTLAIEYAYRLASSYDVAWWIDAQDPGRIGEQIATPAIVAGWALADFDTPKCIVQAKQRLRGLSRWLLVFDNVEDASTVARCCRPARREMCSSPRATRSGGSWANRLR
jgi:hypothetical protein